jgi:hypothetical protein
MTDSPPDTDNQPEKIAVTHTKISGEKDRELMMGAGRLECRGQESVSGTKKTRNYHLILMIRNLGFKIPGTVLKHFTA